MLLRNDKTRVCNYRRSVMHVPGAFLNRLFFARVRARVVQHCYCKGCGHAASHTVQRKRTQVGALCAPNLYAPAESTRPTQLRNCTVERKLAHRPNREISKVYIIIATFVGVSRKKIN